MFVQRAIAFGNPLLIGIVQGDFLLQDEDELGLPRALQALGDDVARGANARVTHRGKGLGVAFAGEDRAHDPHARNVRELDRRPGKPDLNPPEVQAAVVHNNSIRRFLAIVDDL